MSRLSPTQEQVNYLSSLGNPGLAAVSSAQSMGGGKTQATASKKPGSSKVKPASATLNLNFGQFFKKALKVVLCIIVAMTMIIIAYNAFAAEPQFGLTNIDQDVVWEQSISPQFSLSEPGQYLWVEVPLSSVDKHCPKKINTRHLEEVPPSSVDKLMGRIRSVAFLFKAVLVLFILNLFLLWRSFVMHKKVEKFEFVDLAPADTAKTEPGSEPDSEQKALPTVDSSDSPPVTPAEPETDEPAPIVQQTKHKLPTVLQPAEMVQFATRKAEESLKKLSRVPSFPAAPWSVGCASVTGNVRTENQDYGVSLQINGLDVLIVADGVGGTPLGREASYTAVATATYSLICQVNKAGRWQSLDPESMAEKAMADARTCLLTHGRKMGITTVGGGFRTTLIIVVADNKSYGFSHIGDGSGVLIRNGQVRKLFTPHKAGKGYAPNVIAASLGATKQGQATSGRGKRINGDLISICTDGVSDYVDADFHITYLLQHSLRNQGNLSSTATGLVKGLADFTDDVGFVCSDNLTLAIMGTGKKPLIPNGFWQKQNVVEATPTTTPMEAMTC